MHDQVFIVFSTADLNAEYLTNKQHLARELHKRGSTVIYVESFGIRRPYIFSIADILRIAKKIFLFGKIFKRKGIEKNFKNFFIINPLIIPVSLIKYKFIAKYLNIFNIFIIKKKINHALSQISISKRINIWSYHPYYIKEIIEKLDRDVHTVTYHCVDDLASIPRVSKDYNQREKDFCNFADCIFATNINLYNKLEQFNKRIFYDPNVVNLEFFNKKYIKDKQINNNKKIKFVYHGVLNDLKIDFELLFNIFSNNNNLSLYLIGSEPETQRSKTLKKLISLQNVEMLGYKTFEEIPKYICQMDYGILAFVNNLYTNSMSTMKYKEFLAAGLPVFYNCNVEPIDTRYTIKFHNVSDFYKKLDKFEVKKIPYYKRKKILYKYTWNYRINNYNKILYSVYKSNIKYIKDKFIQNSNRNFPFRFARIEKNSSRFEVVTNLLKKDFSNLNNKKINCFFSGAGGGSEIYELGKFFNYHKVFVQEYDKDLIKNLKKIKINGNNIKVYGECIDYDAIKSINFFFSNHVIEHTRNPALYIINNFQMLNKEAYIFFGFPTRYQIIEPHTNVISFEYFPFPIRNLLLSISMTLSKKKFELFQSARTTLYPISINYILKIIKLNFDVIKTTPINFLSSYCILQLRRKENLLLSSSNVKKIQKLTYD